MIQREHHLDSQCHTETIYFIASLPADAKLILHAVRTHWTFDATFHGDDARLKSGHSAENFGVLRLPAKLSLKRKHYRAALDDAFLLELIS